MALIHDSDTAAKIFAFGGRPRTHLVLLVRPGWQVLTFRDSCWQRKLAGRTA